MLFLISAIILHLIIPSFLHPLHDGTSKYTVLPWQMHRLHQFWRCTNFYGWALHTRGHTPRLHTRLKDQGECEQGVSLKGGRRCSLTSTTPHTNLVQLPSPALRSFTTQQNAAASWCLETAAHALADDTCPWSTGLTRPHAKLESSHAETTLRSSSVIRIRI